MRISLLLGIVILADSGLLGAQEVRARASQEDSGTLRGFVASADAVIVVLDETGQNALFVPKLANVSSTSGDPSRAFSLKLEPGKYVVMAFAPGKSLAKETIEVAKGEETLCTADLQEKQSAFSVFRTAKGGAAKDIPPAEELPRATESICFASLKWLARHQCDDGHWSAAGFHKQCKGEKCSGAGGEDYDVGVTALSLLAFLGAGYSHVARDEFKDPVDPERVHKFGEVVKKGLQWLMTIQDKEGCIGGGVKYMYGHAIAALALSEAYGMTASALLKDPAQKAIDFLVAAQNPGKGWRYSAKCGDNDTSVTAWAIMALTSAKISGLSFPRRCCDGVLAWLDEVTDPATGHVGYNAKGTGKVFVPGKNEQFSSHPTTSAMSIMSRIFINKAKAGNLPAVRLLVDDLPEWHENNIDFYYWYFGTLALFQFDGPDGKNWKEWNEPVKRALVDNEKRGKDGCKNGSWDPEVDRWGLEGGRVYATAINTLTLEIYYRYPNVFGANLGK